MKKKLLHVGCGPTSIKDFPNQFNVEEYDEVRLDIDANCNPDIQLSMTAMRDILPPDQFDCIYSSHNLEHLFPHEVDEALRGFLWVLKPGGGVFISVPDIKQVCQFILDKGLVDVAYECPSGPITPLDMLYGYTPCLAQNPFMAHRTGFTKEHLTGFLNHVGFEKIGVFEDGKFGLQAVAYKSITEGNHETE